MQTPPHRPLLDMTPEGEFRDRPPQPGGSRLNRLLLRVGAAAIVLAVIAGLLALAAVAVISLAVLIPAALIFGAVGAVSLWWRMRRHRATASALRPGPG